MGATETDATLQPTADASHSARAFAIGARIGERYRIARFIGEGGMGEVYAAEDGVLGTTVALKTLRSELVDSTTARERFRREIAVARKVSHANVCRLHDVGEHAGRVYTTMELLDGPTLAERLRDRGPVELADLDALARQLIAGLEALHAAGVVHRDFKPSNVMLVGDRAVVTDFGLARSLAGAGGEVALTTEHGLVGTPAYMAPEQVEARAITPATDVYALGAVLYELVTGRPPFREDTAMATATARLRRDAEPPSRLRRDLPAKWDALIRRCLAREPGDRFADAASVRASLDGTRPRSRAALVIGGVVAALALAGGGVYLARREGPVTPEVDRIAPFARYAPSDPRAAELFRQANERLAADDNLGALDRLQDAAVAAPDDAIVQGRLAYVLAALGFEERSNAARRRAMERRHELSEEPRLFIERLDAEAAQRLPEAVALSRRLVALAPQEYEYRYFLVQTLVNVADVANASIELALARAHVPGEAARASWQLCDAQVSLVAGDFPTAVAKSRETLELARSTHQRRTEALSQFLLSYSLMRSDPVASRRAAEAAIAVAATSGDALVMFSARKVIADLDLSQGHLAARLEQYAQNIAMVRPLGSTQLLVGFLLDSVPLLMELGRFEQAARTLDEAEKLVAGDGIALAWIDYQRGWLAFYGGRLAEATDHLETALRRKASVRPRTTLDSPMAGLIDPYATGTLWDIAFERGDDDATAVAYARHAAFVVDGSPYSGAPIITPIHRAAMASRRGRNAEARGYLGAIVDKAPTAASADAFALLARLEARDGKPGDAAALLDRVRPLLLEGLRSATSLALGDAEVRAARGDLSGAIAVLDECVERNRKVDARDPELAAEALAVELSLRAGVAGAAERRQRAIAKATELGYVRRAKEMAALPP